MDNKQKRAIWYTERERSLKHIERRGLMDAYKAFKGNSKREKMAYFEKMLRKSGGYLFDNITPIYSGGGIYIYAGHVNNTYFLADDDGLCYTSCNVVNMIEDGEYMSYITGYMNDVNFKDFYRFMLKWIIEHKPQNKFTNYAMADMITRLQKSGE